MSRNDKARSVSKRLSNLAREKDVPYINISTSFFLERLLARLVADQNLKKQLIFKGGYVGLRVYNSSRYTVDLDAIINKSDLTKVLPSVRLYIESKNLDDCVWFKFEREEKLQTQSDCGGFRQVYRVGLGEMPDDVSKCNLIHLDIGIGDSVTPGPIETSTESILDNETLGWQVYSIESIIAEKLHAFISRDGDSSRSKDIFDLAFYLPKADSKILKDAIENCFKNRSTPLPENMYTRMSSFDFNLTKMGWKKVISSMAEPVEFEDCLAVIFKQLKENYN